MQSLWSNQLDWDDPLPEVLCVRWQQFLTELPFIFKLILPRHIDTTEYQDIQLLGFADASVKGYAATIYLRVGHKSKCTTVHLLSCKTKVAPLKSATNDESLSIPW